jgi:Bacterial Ig domain/RTX calcium-binding nonapeptide repeat (4 copies)
MKSRPSKHRQGQDAVQCPASSWRALLMCTLLLLSQSSVLRAADVTGTNNNDLLFFLGIVESRNTTLTNPYSGETVGINNLYNVNTVKYDGLGGTDTLLMTNIGDALFLENDAGEQTLFSIERVIAGDGNDVVNLASTRFTLGDTLIDGGLSDDILWGNSGNDTINGGQGNDRIDGGPGDDTISGGDNDDTLDGGAGSDIVHGDAGNDLLVYTPSQNLGNTDAYDGGTGIDTLVLRLTAAQDDAYAADIVAARAFIAAHYDDTSSMGPGYTFSSFGLTVSNIEAIEVAIISNTPPNANRDDFTGTINHPITGNVLVDNGHGADTDSDGDSLSVEVATIATTAGGQVSLNADGTFTYNPAANFYGSDSFTYKLLDTHGGSASGTVNLTINNTNVDNAPPSSGAQLSPSPNAQGWNNSNVTVVINTTDNTGGSGVKSITYSATGAQSIASTTVLGTWTREILISTEGVTTISFHATDQSGNVESPDDSVTVKLDKSAPAINCASPDGLWHATDVSIGCTASDRISGLAVAGDASFSLSTSVATNTENNNASTNSRFECDLAGNCASAGPIAGNMVDKRPPSITMTTPANSGSYLLNTAVASNYQCQDGGSGVQSCAGPVANGANFDTASAGPKTFSVTSKDKANNVSSASDSYRVLYANGGSCNGDAGHQILQPINVDGSSVWKRGSTIPAKFRACDARAISIGTPGMVAGFRLMKIIAGTTTVVDEAVVSTTPDTAFRWDATAQQWIFNISTTGLSANQTYVYEIQLNDGSSIFFQFGLR